MFYLHKIIQIQILNAKHVNFNCIAMALSSRLAKTCGIYQSDCIRIQSLIESVLYTVFETLQKKRHFRDINVCKQIKVYNCLTISDKTGHKVECKSCSIKGSSPLKQTQLSLKAGDKLQKAVISLLQM